MNEESLTKRFLKYFFVKKKYVPADMTVLALTVLVLVDESLSFWAGFCVFVFGSFVVVVTENALES